MCFELLTLFILDWNQSCRISSSLKSCSTINQAATLGVSVSIFFFVGGECNNTSLLSKGGDFNGELSEGGDFNGELSKGGDFNGELHGLVVIALSVFDVLRLKSEVSVCNQGHQYLCSATGSKFCFSCNENNSS